MELPPLVAPARLRPLNRLRPALGALIFGSVVCFVMLAARVWYARLTHVRSHTLSGLGGNLLLAWIPLVLSLLLRRLAEGEGWRRFWFCFTGVLWVLFYPNSFYLVTDFVHLKKFGSEGLPKMYDVMMTAAFGFAGVFLGSLALYLLHLMVRERFGYRVGWLFATGMLVLSSFGIYVGRFWRWNSWEPFTRPWKLWASIRLLFERPDHFIALSGTFFAFSLMAYFFVVAMARLHEGEV